MRRGFIEIAGLTTCGCLLLVLVGVGLTVGFYFVMGGNDNNQAVNVDDERTDISAEDWVAIFRSAEAEIGTPWELTAAIMYSESSGGTNFGSCSYYPPPPSGGRVLSESQVRDEDDRLTFKSIVESLDYPLNKPVSCNQAASGQNGGAIGYMQIMPPEWSGAAAIVSSYEIKEGVLNPWNALDAAYVGAQVLRNKAGVSDINLEFPEDELSIKLTISKYLGHNERKYTREYLLNRTYVTDTYAKYIEYESAGAIT